MWRLLLLGASLALAPTVAHAERPVVVVIVGDGAPGADAARAQVEAHARAAGHDIVPAEGLVAALASRAAIASSAVAELEVALGGLSRAKALAGRLEEDAALAELARTRRRIDALLALPGASRWAAEVEVAIAIVAHQADAAALAERSLRAAATLDRARAIGSAEAPPELLARARAIAEEVAVGPRGSFVVATDAAGARAYLDDVPLERAAGRVDGSAFQATAPVGQHVLRVEAAGHRPYAARLEVFAGERAPVAIRLAADPRAQAAERAIDAARRGDLPAAVAELRAAGLRFELWAAMASTGGGRILLSRCEAAGCADSERLEGGRVTPAAAARAGADPFADRAFLFAAEPVRPEEADATPRRRRRALLYGAAAALAVGAGIAGAVVASRPDAPRGLSATIDFGGLDPGRRLP